MIETSDNNAGRTLVVADDESHIRLVVAEKFRSAGFNVIEARDGEEALAAVRTHMPDALITDLQMPYMNGLELCAQLAADPLTASVPAVLLTARGHILDPAQVAKTGIRRVMGKPFSARELFAFVTQILLETPTRAASIKQKQEAGSMGIPANYKAA